MAKLLSRMRSNALVETFCELKGNPKIAVLTQPLWSIPNVLYAPFATLYMYALGLNDLNIGYILTAGMASQMVFAFLGGVITDKFGRRKTQALFDFIGWVIPCILWAFSQNFIWFLTAQVFNGAFQATTCSFNCLFTEDCPPKYLVNGFTLIQLTGMFAVFFSPIAIILVSQFSLELVVRWIYGIAGVLMLLKMGLLYFCGGETSVGKIRLAETKDISYFTMFKDYYAVFVKMLRSKQMRLVLLLMIVTSVYTIATGSFFSLYITTRLQLSDQYVAIFPMIRGIVMIIFLVGLQPIINKFSIKSSMKIGLICYIASHILLLLSPAGSVFFVTLYTLLESIGFAMVIPRRDALMSLSMDPKERSRIYALVTIILLCITAPFASIIGYMSLIDRRLPFIFNIVLFILLIVLIGTSKVLSEIEKKQHE